MNDKKVLLVALNADKSLTLVTKHYHGFLLHTIHSHWDLASAFFGDYVSPHDQRGWPGVAILKSFCGKRSSNLRGNYGSLCRRTESASEWSYRINISCTAGPNMYSQGVLACICHCITPSSLSFPNWTAPSWTLSTVFWMLASVWSAALLFGELPPGGGVGGEKRLDLEEKKTSLFVEERNSNPWWQTDAGWFFPEVTGSWWSN